MNSMTPHEAAPRDQVGRAVGIVLLLAIALVHLLDAVAKFHETRYVFWLYIALMLASFMVAVVLLRTDSRLAWTLVAYGLLGFGTVEVVRRLAGLDGFPTVGPILLILGVSAGVTALRVSMDGELARAAIWFTGIGWAAVTHLVTEAPSCGTLVFGAGLPPGLPGGGPDSTDGSAHPVSAADTGHLPPVRCY